MQVSKSQMKRSMQNHTNAITCIGTQTKPTPVQGSDHTHGGDESRGRGVNRKPRKQTVSVSDSPSHNIIENIAMATSSIPHVGGRPSRAAQFLHSSTGCNGQKVEVHNGSVSTKRRQCSCAQRPVLTGNGGRPNGVSEVLAPSCREQEQG